MANKHTNQYQDYLGKSRAYMMSTKGNEFNYYLSDIWYYRIKTNWLGKKTFLLILFEKDCVCKIAVKKTYKKLENFISTKDTLLLDDFANLHPTY